jgi:DNA ligase-1
MDSIRKGSGLAVRFSRFTGSYRLDRAAEGAATVEEVVEMCKSQLRKSLNSKPWLVLRKYHAMRSR